MGFGMLCLGFQWVITGFGRFLERLDFLAGFNGFWKECLTGLSWILFMGLTRVILFQKGSFLWIYKCSRWDF